MQDGVKSNIVNTGVRTKKAAFSIIDFIKKYVLCLGKTDLKEKEKAVRIIMAIAIFCFITSLYPVFKKYLKIK